MLLYEGYYFIFSSNLQPPPEALLAWSRKHGIALYLHQHTSSPKMAHPETRSHKKFDFSWKTLFSFGKSTFFHLFFPNSCSPSLNQKG